jgi:hypothetical protein
MKGGKEQRRRVGEEEGGDEKEGSRSLASEGVQGINTEGKSHLPPPLLSA